MHFLRLAHVSPRPIDAKKAMLSCDDDSLESGLTTFDDLLRYNVAFLQGRLPCTFYYTARWGEGEDQGNHVSTSTQNLLELHRHGVFTFCGQSNECEAGVHHDAHPGGILQVGDYYELEQNSFVCFCLPRVWAVRLIHYFAEHMELPYTLALQDGKNTDGNFIMFTPKFEGNIMALTKERVNHGEWDVITGVRYGDPVDTLEESLWPDHLKPLRAQLYFGMLTTGRELSDEVLLRIIKEIGAPVLAL